MAPKPGTTNKVPLPDVAASLVIEFAVLHEPRQGQRCEVANSDLGGRGVLDDLRAEIRLADGAQILLVGLAVG